MLLYPLRPRTDNTAFPRAAPAPAEPDWCAPSDTPRRVTSIFWRTNETEQARTAANQYTMSGTGMTQEMEALAFEGSQGVELTDEEAEESARAYDE